MQAARALGHSALSDCAVAVTGGHHITEAAERGLSSCLDPLIFRHLTGGASLPPFHPSWLTITVLEHQLMTLPYSKTFNSSLRLTDQISSRREHKSKCSTLLFRNFPSLITSQPPSAGCVSSRLPGPPPFSVKSPQMGTQNRWLQASPEQSQVGERPETQMLKNHTAMDRAGTQIQTSLYCQNHSL